MAIVKFPLFKNNAHESIKYVDKQVEDKSLITYSPGLPNDPKGAAERFVQIQAMQGKKGKNQAVEFIQSWGVEESKKYSPEMFHLMGKELTEKYFKGHEYVIVTHATTKFTHNHIIVNAVNHETGQRINNKKKVREKYTKELRTLNDEINKEHGLSVLEEKKTKDKFKKPFWQKDLMKKADFARALATSFDEYVGYLGEMNVKVKIEDKNISYLYGANQRKRRGSKLGEDYDKSGLVKAFKDNDLRFKSDPKIKEHFLSGLGTYINERGISIKLTGDQNKPYEKIKTESKDYAKFTKAPRRDSPYTVPNEESLKNSLIPMAEIRNAARGNIVEYCRRNSIKLQKDQNGKVRLQSRKFIIIKDNQWINTKNKTTGNLIEFVSLHKKYSYIESIAHITGNKRILLLEQAMDKKPKAYQSFKLPKEKQMDSKQAVSRMAYFLRGMGYNPQISESLLANKQAQVSKKGSIRLFGQDDEGGAYEYTQEKNGDWQQKKYGVFNSPFYAKPALNNKAVIFTDPFSYLKEKGKGNLSKLGDAGILVLMEPDKSLLGKYLYQNPNIERLSFVKGSYDKRGKSQDIGFDKFKGKLKHNDIEFNTINIDSGFNREELGLDVEF